MRFDSYVSIGWFDRQLGNLHYPSNQHILHVLLISFVKAQSFARDPLPLSGVRPANAVNPSCGIRHIIYVSYIYPHIFVATQAIVRSTKAIHGTGIYYLRENHKESTIHVGK